jgi:hypothetical protein
MDLVTGPERTAARAQWLAAIGWGDAVVAPLPGDASFRRYFRLTDRRGPAMLMDAPPQVEPRTPTFVAIAERLGAAGLSAPAVLAADLAQGFLLLEDLGDTTFTRALAAGADEASLYHAAIAVLIHLHTQPPGPFIRGLPRYDAAAYRDELKLFTDWYVPAATGLTVDGEALVAAWHTAAAVLDRAPTHLVLRDYHVDNLMVLDRASVAGTGLLDFQDALAGPSLYDLVSLVDDARRDVPADLAARLLATYRDALALPAEWFDAAVAVMSVQRLIKIIGIFTRLDRRDGKPHYRAHLPRLWRVTEHRLSHPALSAVSAEVDRLVPSSARERD